MSGASRCAGLAAARDRERADRGRQGRGAARRRATRSRSARASRCPAMSRCSAATVSRSCARPVTRALPRQPPTTWNWCSSTVQPRLGLLRRGSVMIRLAVGRAVHMMSTLAAHCQSAAPGLRTARARPHGRAALALRQPADHAGRRHQPDLDGARNRTLARSALRTLVHRRGARLARPVHRRVSGAGLGRGRARARPAPDARRARG